MNEKTFSPSITPTQEICVCKCLNCVNQPKCNIGAYDSFHARCHSYQFLEYWAHIPKAADAFLKKADLKPSVSFQSPVAFDIEITGINRIHAPVETPLWHIQFYLYIGNAFRELKANYWGDLPEGLILHCIANAFLFYKPNKYLSRPYSEIPTLTLNNLRIKSASKWAIAVSKP